jgi:hypothetical protein
MARINGDARVVMSPLPEHRPRYGVSPEGDSIETPFSMSLRYAKTET